MREWLLVVYGEKQIVTIMTGLTFDYIPYQGSYPWLGYDSGPEGVGYPFGNMIPEELYANYDFSNSTHCPRYGLKISTNISIDWPKAYLSFVSVQKA